MTDDERVELVARAILAADDTDLLARDGYPEDAATDFAHAALAALQPASVGPWKPIETFAEPTTALSGDGVLVADADGTVGEAYFRNCGDGDDGWWWANTSWGDYPEPERPNSPTHWMPLPSPPTQDSK